jgi:hypothetical protein
MLPAVATDDGFGAPGDPIHPSLPLTADKPAARELVRTSRMQMR